MKPLLVMTALMLGALSPATAAPNAPAPAAAVKAPFGCEAGAGNVCRFRIFYPGGRTRDVVLPGGMKVSIPEVRIGKDSYCVVVNKKAVHKCPRKLVDAKYNS